MLRAKVLQSCSTVCASMECSPPEVHGISQVRILEWVVISFSRGSSQPKDGTQVSCIGRWFLYHWASREALFMLTGIEFWRLVHSFLCVLEWPLNLGEGGYGPCIYLFYLLFFKNQDLESKLVWIWNSNSSEFQIIWNCSRISQWV